MKFRQTKAGESVLAVVSCIVDVPLLKLMEEDYQPAGTAEKADYWMRGKGCIRFRNLDQIEIGSLIKVSAVRIVRAYTETECRMIIIEPLKPYEPRDDTLKRRSPEELAVRIARFIGACSNVISTIKSRWPDESESESEIL